MCLLCSEDTREAERNNLTSLSCDMRMFASQLDNLVSGVYKPHSDTASTMCPRATNIIRELVERYL